MTRRRGGCTLAAAGGGGTTGGAGTSGGGATGSGGSGTAGSGGSGAGNGGSTAAPAAAPRARVAATAGSGGARRVRAEQAVRAEHGGPAAGSGTWRPFSADSPWNTRIPANPEIDPDSAAMIADFATSSPYGPKIDINMTQWTVPVFWADANTPRVLVRAELGGLGFTRQRRHERHRHGAHPRRGHARRPDRRAHADRRSSDADRVGVLPGAAGRRGLELHPVREHEPDRHGRPPVQAPATPPGTPRTARAPAASRWSPVCCAPSRCAPAASNTRW